MHWEGYNEKDATWEPIENLVNAAETVRAFDAALEATEKLRRQEIIDARSAAKACTG